MGKEKLAKDDAQENKKDIPLFREEALQHKKGSYLGKATIISPISFTCWAVGIFAIAVALVLFLYFGKYSKRQEVIGMLVPNKGLIRVYPSSPGIVTERLVHQGDNVVKGQLLYLISTEHQTLSGQGSSAQTIEILEKQLVLQKSKLAVFEKNLARYKQLLEQKFVSEMEYQKAYDEYLGVDLALHKIEQELIQAKSVEKYALRSPDDGVISTLVAIVGDHVSQDKPLATIVPKGAVLQGMLFVHSDAIGFVKIGQTVLLKYDAYPYQRFGLYESTVESIDKSVLFLKDLDLQQINISTDLKNPYKSNDPFYRVIVNLKLQTVMAYGKSYQLTPGMTLKGSILGEQRNIWQWIMDPIYSLRGSLTGP